MQTAREHTPIVCPVCASLVCAVCVSSLLCARCGLHVHAAADAATALAVLAHTGDGCAVRAERAQIKDAIAGE